LEFQETDQAAAYGKKCLNFGQNNSRRHQHRLFWLTFTKACKRHSNQLTI